MIRILDTLWFRLLDRLNLWTLNRLAAHCRREQDRCFRRYAAGQKNHLN